MGIGSNFQKSRVSEAKTALQSLKQLHFENWKQKYPNIDTKYYASYSYSDKTANNLTRCIIDFIKFKKGQAERISSEGRIVDNRKTTTDCIGRTKTVGSIKRTYSTTTNGTADISAIYKGVSLKIEVKIGSDKQSDAQKAYEEAVKAAGGVYYIAKDLESFYTWFNAFFKTKEGGVYAER